MGNFFPGVSIDTEQFSIENLDILTFNERRNPKFVSNIKLWSYGPNGSNLIEGKSEGFSNFQSFNSSRSYLILHLFRKVGTKSYQTFVQSDVPTKSDNEGRVKMTKLMSSFLKDLKPEGVKQSFSINTLSEFFQKPSIGYDLYLMNGKNSSGSVNAYALNAGYEMERWLVKNECNLESLFCHGTHIGLSEFIQNDLIIGGGFERNLFEKIHLYRFISTSFKMFPLSKSSILSQVVKFPNVRTFEDQFLELERKWIGNMKEKVPEKYLTMSEQTKLLENQKERDFSQFDFNDIQTSPSTNFSTSSFDSKFVSGSELVIHFRKIISRICPFLFLSGVVVAKNKSLLQINGITHVINAAACIAENYFPDNFRYLSFPLLDDGRQGVFGFILQSISFIVDAVESGGKVLVHCMEGVSRSSVFVLAYEMWNKNLGFDEVNEYVKRIRKTISPNAGFIVQLYQWEEVLTIHKQQSFLFRVVPLSEKYDNLIIKYCYQRILDSRTTFILVGIKEIFIWIGKESDEKCMDSAKMHAKLFKTLVKKEKCLVVFVSEGEESFAFKECLKTVVEKELIKDEYSDIEMLQSKRIEGKKEIEDEIYETMEEKIQVVNDNERKKEKSFKKKENENEGENEEIEEEDEGEYHSEDGEDEGEFDDDYSEKLEEDEGEDDEDYLSYDGAELYLAPLFETISQFDSDDIYDNPQKVFILKPKDPSECIFVWVGCSFDRKGKETSVIGKERGMEFIEHAKMNKNTEIRVTYDDDIEYFDKFFKYFLNG